MERIRQQNTLTVYRTLPRGCIAFLVTDEYAKPFIQPGDWVVVDTEDRTARVGDIYVIQWNGGRRNVCQARYSAKMWQTEGQPPVWHVGSMRTRTREEFEAWLIDSETKRKQGMIPMWTGAWTEGPFDLDHLESKLVGAVIGIYSGEFQEPAATADYEISRLTGKLKEAVEKKTGETWRTDIDVKTGFILIAQHLQNGKGSS